MDWEGVPDDYSNFLGFVYIVTNLKTGKKYIGKKNFWKDEKRDALKTRTKAEQDKRDKLQTKYDNGLIKTKKALALLLADLTKLEKERRSKLKGKKRRVRVETKWKDYCGSSNEILEDVEHNGHSHYKREIIWLCTGLFWLAYLELQEQLKANALFRKDYLNGILNIRLGNTVSESDFDNQVKVFEPKY